MDIELLKTAVSEIKDDIETAITSSQFNGRNYDNGQKAKEALIRSSKLILKIHEVTKVSLNKSIKQRPHVIHPPLNSSSPELSITGFIKAKKQDIVILFDNAIPKREEIVSGPMKGEFDKIGKDVSNRSIIVGIRSQLSSVAKNFDTLMERAFAETLNLRLRLPNCVMGEVYLLPVYEYDDRAMVQNRVEWKDRPVPVDKFIRTFIGISQRKAVLNTNDLYKYERSCLLLVNLKTNPPKVYLTTDELKEDSIISESFEEHFEILSPLNFADDLISVYNQRFPVR
jgi:hypothetical protein